MVHQNKKIISDLGQLIEIKDCILSANTGLDAIKRAPIVNYDTGIRCLRIQDISQNKHFDDWGFTSVEEQQYNKFQLKKDDIIIARTGETVGVNTYIRNDLQSVFNNGLIRIRVNEDLCYPKFLYYNFRSKNFASYIYNISRGTSTQPNIQINALLKFPIKLPSLLKQQQIASILSSLDNKIELLHEQNKTFDDLAQTIFKQWFIDFNFPDENGKPYKDSGGIMVDSELGKIPKGWQIKNLDNYLEFIRGIEPGSREYNDHKISDEYVQFIRVADLQLLGNTYIHKSLAKDKLVNEYNVLMSFDGTIGRVKIGLAGAYSSGIRKVVYKETNKNIFNCSNQFIYFLLQTDNIQNTIIINATGTTILHAGHTIKLLKIAINHEVIDGFNEIVLPLYQQLISNYNETKLLQQIRDVLLPKLMSGEIKI